MGRAKADSSRDKTALRNDKSLKLQHHPGMRLRRETRLVLARARLWKSSYARLIFLDLFKTCGVYDDFSTASQESKFMQTGDSTTIVTSIAVMALDR